jgi:hypothetical protein
MLNLSALVLEGGVKIIKCFKRIKFLELLFSKVIYFEI